MRIQINKILKEVSGNFLENNDKKAIIISISGYKLTKSEINIFRNYLPWGVILFRRNIKNFNQLKELISSIKKITKDKRYPILIDEEEVKFQDYKILLITNYFRKNILVKFMRPTPILELVFIKII